MNKLLQKLRTLAPKHDKLEHNFYEGVIRLGLLLLCGLFRLPFMLVPLTLMVIAVMIEIWQWASDEGEPSIVDFLYTCVETWLLYALLYWFLLKPYGLW